MLIENFLNNIAYLYYPKDKSIFDLDYNDTTEHRLYMKKVYLNHSCDDDELVLFLKKLNEKIKPLSIVEFKMGSNFPSYNFQIILDSNKSNVISVYISHLIPFFHIRQLEGNINLNKSEISINKDYSGQVLDLVNLIKNELNQNIFYYEFPDDKLLKTIPKIRTEENFTYFNAFFIDYYRIINF
ncbi:hypothetical protein [Flavobacterium nackdongense]|uniref:Uncharacterized protein n=1 Tax=Flavobacterium nackdongense TaxID=2547394 RepID=A0A4P6YEK1_9FLAO|nr:hypothetical protein [Flavobacterium nackdongense]QBN19254.1 hypothetical protein E1750_10720 [Flavobacterium nackdongense]